MARLLIERETIYQDEVDLIMEGKDVKEILEFMDKRDKERIENPFKRYTSDENKADGNADTTNNAESEKVDNAESEKVEEKPNENASETVEKAPKTPTADEDNAEDKKE